MGLERPRVVFVVPTLNEERGVGPTLERIHATMQKIGFPYHILVVDGGSTDKTVEIAREKDAEVIRQRRRGYGDAYTTGFQHVKKHIPDADIIIMIDADGTYPPEELPKLIEPILNGEADEVICIRQLTPGSMTLVNRFGNKILTAAIKLLTGVDVKDTQCGYRAMKSDVAYLDYELTGMEFATEQLVKAYMEGYKIAQVPLPYHKRLGGEPKTRPLKDGWRILKTTIKLMWLYNPTFLVFAIGALLIIPGAVLLAQSAYTYIFEGQVRWIRAILGTATFSTGLVSLSIAILSLLIKRAEIRIMRKINVKTMGDIKNNYNKSFEL